LATLHQSAVRLVLLTVGKLARPQQQQLYCPLNSLLLIMPHKETLFLQIFLTAPHHYIFLLTEDQQLQILQNDIFHKNYVANFLEQLVEYGTVAGTRIYYM
jgi:exonuclease V gamma subunit